ncbi:MAG: extracellular solute-binding protein [Clostridia bacterium]|nr:extracellular solute-binding protein [Clostridia bacterium]
MKMIKTALSVLLIGSMLLLLLAACGDKTSSSSPANTTPSAAGPTAEETTTADPATVFELPDLNFDGEEVHFLTSKNSGYDWYTSKEIYAAEQNGELFNDAVYLRNLTIEEKYGVDITEEKKENAHSVAQKSLLAGDTQYDVVMPYINNTIGLAQQGLLYNLYDVPNLDLDKVWWDQRANSDLTINGKLFFTTGDFSLLTYDCTHAIVFNKKLARDSGCDDMYQLLKDDNWTFDTLWSNAKLVTADTNGVDGMTYEDTWGFYLNQNFTTSMFIGSGERLTNKDNDDIPQLAPLNDRYSAVVDKIRQIYNDKTSTIIIEDYQSQISGKDSDVYSAASRATGEGRALFRSLAMVDLSELDAYDVEYGLLPVPKYNADQEEYYNIVSAFLASCICIHNQVEDPEMSAAVAEAIAISSTSTVRRAYYDTILKGRRIPDEDGEFALDTIFNNRVYEIATIYKFGNLRELIQTCARSSTDILVSTYTSMEGSVNAAIEDLKDTFDSID